MITNYNREFQPVARTSSSRLWTLLKAGKVAVLFATTFAYYSLRAGIILDVEPIEGKESGLREANRIISNLLSSPIVASVSAGGFAGSALGFALAVGLFIVAIISGATEADFTAFMPLSYYLIAVSLFVMSGALFGGLGGGLLGMIYSGIASLSNVRNKLFGVTVFGLLGGLIGEIAGVITTVNIFAFIAFVISVAFMSHCC